MTRRQTSTKRPAIKRRVWSRTSFQRARRSSFKMVGMGLIFVGCAAATVVGVRAFQKSDVFRVEQVKVFGAQQEHISEIQIYADLREGTPLFSVDKQALARSIEAHPYVQSAKVELEVPGIVKLTIVEREPFALVSANGLYVIDDKGIPFARYEGGLAELPLLTGDVVDVEDAEKLDIEMVLLGLLSLDALRAVDAGLPEEWKLFRLLAEVHLVRGFGVEMVFQHGLRVRLGENGLSAKLKKAQKILRHLQKQGLEPMELHLDDARQSERVAVRLRPKLEVAEDSGT